MKSIVVVDPFWRGHHPTYMKLFSRVLLSLGHRVIAISPNPQEIMSDIKENAGGQVDFEAFEVQEPMTPVIPTSRFQKMKSTLNLWNAARSSIENAVKITGRSPDLVFFAWLDSYLGNHLSHYLVDRYFPYPWSGLYFHPSHLRIGQRFSPIRKGPLDCDNILRSPKCRSVAVLDEGIASKLELKLRHKSVIVFPDVADDSPVDLRYEDVVRINQLANERKKIGIIGGLAKRKGLLNLLNVAKCAQNENWFFIFAGRLVRSTFTANELAVIDDLKKNPLPNCFFSFSDIPDEPQFNALIKTCDLLYAVYDNFPHSSNILGKAALFDKPVIVANGFCMGERVKKFHLGLQIDGNDVKKTIDAIRSLLNASSSALPDAEKPDFKGYREQHSRDRLSAVFKKLIEISAA